MTFTKCHICTVKGGNFMKKLYGIIGTICSIIGLILTLAAQTVIWSNTRYTWSRPYTQFEAETLSVKWIGIVLLISGIIDILLIVISKIYADKNIKDATIQEFADIICPNCGLRVSKTTNVCPKCKNNVKEEIKNGTNNN